MSSPHGVQLVAPFPSLSSLSSSLTALGDGRPDLCRCLSRSCSRGCRWSTAAGAAPAPSLMACTGTLQAAAGLMTWVWCTALLPSPATPPGGPCDTLHCWGSFGLPTRCDWSSCCSVRYYTHTHCCYCYCYYYCGCCVV